MRWQQSDSSRFCCGFVLCVCVGWPQPLCAINTCGKVSDSLGGTHGKHLITLCHVVSEITDLGSCYSVLCNTRVILPADPIPILFLLCFLSAVLAFVTVQRMVVTWTEWEWLSRGDVCQDFFNNFFPRSLRNHANKHKITTHFEMLSDHSLVSVKEPRRILPHSATWESGTQNWNCMIVTRVHVYRRRSIHFGPHLKWSFLKVQIRMGLWVSFFNAAWPTVTTWREERNYWSPLKTLKTRTKNPNCPVSALVLLDFYSR